MYAGRHVLVTGGLGFVGSNLAIRLAELGARVTIIDSAVPGCGANPFNIEPIRDRVRLIAADIGEAESFRDEIARADVIFNLAGEISHTESMRRPERDLAINTAAQLRFLLACRKARPGVRVVFAGTRQVYGRPEYLPIDEGHPVHPVDFNGVHKAAATEYHLVLSRFGDVDAIVIRLTNIYGPRMAVNLPQQGVFGTFLRLALLGSPLVVYGDGAQFRDPVYVDDAVNAFLLAGSASPARSRVYNIAGPESLSLAEIADGLAEAAGAAVIRRPFPDDRKCIDIGSYVGNPGRIQRELGWTAGVRFAEGIRRTLAYYRENLSHYLDPDEPKARDRASGAGRNESAARV